MFANRDLNVADIRYETDFERPAVVNKDVPSLYASGLS